MAQSPLLSAGMMIIVTCVVLVIGGLILLETYIHGAAAAGGSTTLGTVICWQESANVSPSCAGTRNGSYNTSYWNVTSPEKSFDTNWSSYSSDLCDTGSNVFRAIYNIPINTTTTVWRVMDTINGVRTNHSYTITNSSCDYHNASNYILYGISWWNYTTNYCQLSYACAKPGGGYTYFNQAPSGPP